MNKVIKSVAQHKIFVLFTLALHQIFSTDITVTLLTLYKLVLHSKTLIVGHINAEKGTAARKPDLYPSLLNSRPSARRWNHLQTVAASLICPTEANLHADCTGMNAHTFYFRSLLYFYFSTVLYCVIFHWYWEYFLVEFCKVYGIADTSI